MVIRLATLSDVPKIMLMIAELVPVMQAGGNFQWDSTYPNAKVFEEDILHNQLWLADNEGDVAGIAAITTDQDPEYAEVGWDINETAIVTHRLAVNIKYRGQGIALKLMQRAEQVAIERSIEILRIDTNSQNIATQHLFPKLGYKFAGEIGLGFRPNLRFYCYEKRLNASS